MISYLWLIENLRLALKLTSASNRYTMKKLKMVHDDHRVDNNQKDHAQLRILSKQVHIMFPIISGKVFKLVNYLIPK